MVIISIVVFFFVYKRKEKKESPKKTIDNIIATESDENKASWEGLRSKSDETGLKDSASTVSLRSEINDSDESLEAAINRAKASDQPSDKDLSTKGKTLSMIEADELLESIKSNEDID